MSHFTVTVHLTKQRLDRHDGDVDSALEEILAPFNENVEEGDEYAEFEDVTDQYRKEYENDSTKMIRCPDGSLVHPWDDRFRKPGSFGLGTDTHEVPENAGYEKVQIAHKERFATFAKFMKDWAGYSKTKDGRYGSWRNPNAKWDWYTIGGRWRGYFPVKPGVEVEVGKPGAFDNESAGGSDVVRIDQIDFDTVSRQQRERFEKFKTEYRQYLQGAKFDAFDGPRDQMLRLGLLRVEQDPRAALKPGEVQVGPEWGEQHAHIQGTDRAHWRDIALDLTDEQLERYLAVFNPLRTYAVLDDNGWHAPGEMGWFGCSSDEPDGLLAYADAYNEKFIKPCAPDDVLVLVDCHI